MDKFLIEAAHEATRSACVNAINIFHESGSHFLSNAEWGCEDGEHKPWMVVEVKSREEAQRILPAMFRSEAKIVR